MTAHDRPRVSAIVCNLNGMRFLPRLLASLDAQQGVDVQVVVVDRESTDGSRSFLAARPTVTVVTEPAASGLVAGYHAAVPAADSDLLFFCNEDLWLDPSCLARLARHISLADRVGAADPWQWSYDGTRLIRAGVRFVAVRHDPVNCYPRRALDFLVPLAAGDTVPFGSGGAVLVHRAMYADVGGWDPSFFMDFDDGEFFLRAWRRGWRCVTEPAARVYHAVGMSTEQAGRPPAEVLFRRRVGGESNRAVICLKHFDGFPRLWGAVDLFLPLAGSMIRGRWAQSRIYLAALWRTLGRLPAVGHYRSEARRRSPLPPGLDYFTLREHQRPP
jgi:N-acetylglucosaminyl-diphospho-decaprenol L-rhamnosyltransferase